MLSYYAPGIAAFGANNGKFDGTSYGRAIFSGVDGKESQWNDARSVLSTDPETRRGIILIGNGAAVRGGHKSRSCLHDVLSLHF
jgi:hypothetical protein